MSTILWVILGAVLLLVVLNRVVMARLGGAISRALAEGDIGSLVGRISEMPPSVQPAAYNSAVHQIWDAYRRPLAIRLIKEMARNVGVAAIAQYWIRQALEVEPELAHEQFDSEFLDTYYRPDVARQCGSFG